MEGRAWLAALPEELTAQRRVLTGLVDRCEAWPLATSLLVGCSLGRGAADELSDIDAALGVDAPRGEAGAGRVTTMEAMVVAALPELGALVDVLRHPTGAASQHVRRIFAQFADGTQLDLAVVADAEIEARRRAGGAPDFVSLYQAPASAEPDPRMPGRWRRIRGRAAGCVRGHWRAGQGMGLPRLDRADRRGQVLAARLAMGGSQPTAGGTPPHLGAVGCGTGRHVPVARPVAGARPRPR